MSWVPLHSTLLEAVVYQDEASVLELRFHGGAVYRYLGVPAIIYQELLGAESKGQYFNSRIRNRFVTALVSPTERDSGPPETTQR